MAEPIRAKHVLVCLAGLGAFIGLTALGIHLESWKTRKLSGAADLEEELRSLRERVERLEAHSTQGGSDV